MLLADLVEVSRRVAESPGRTAKAGALAAFLRRLAPEEIAPEEIEVAFLSGVPRQGKLGLGYATLGEEGEMRRKTFVGELKDLESRRALAEALTALLDRWDVGTADRSRLLGMDQGAPLGPGEALPEDPAVLERAGHLLAIGRALHRVYPYLPTLRDRWVLTPEPALGGKPPLAVMLAGGIEGIRKVREVIESGAAA